MAGGEKCSPDTKTDLTMLPPQGVHRARKGGNGPGANGVALRDARDSAAGDLEDLEAAGSGCDGLA